MNSRRITITCPSCKAQVDPQARFCPACYTVFPSDSGYGSRRLTATTARGRTWKVPSLLVVAVLGAWLLQVDQSDWDPEPGSYQAAARDMKRQFFDWIAASTGSGAPSPIPRSKERVDDLHKSDPAGFLDNASKLPCALGAYCEAVIRFDPDNSARYIIERPNDGGARIFALEPRGSDLLNKSTRAQLVIDVPAGGTQLISIARMEGDRWSIIEEVQHSVDGADLSHSSGREGA